MEATGKRLATAGFLVLALGFAALALVGQWGVLDDLGGGSEIRWSLSVGWLSAALVLGTVNLLGMAAAWVWLARRFGEPMEYREGIAAWVGANLGRYIPGKVWQLAGLAAYLRGRGHSGSVAVVSALVFQLVVLITGLLAAVLTLGRRIGPVFEGSRLAPLVLAAFLALFLHPALLRRGTALLSRLFREDDPDSASAVVPDEALGISGTLLPAGTLLLAWAVYGTGLWCLLAGSLEQPVGGVPTMTGVFAASYVTGYLAVVAPGGLVVREGAMTLLLAAVTPLPAATAAVVAVAARLWTILSELAAFGLAMLLRRAGGAGNDGIGFAGQRGAE